MVFGIGGGGNKGKEPAAAAAAVDAPAAEAPSNASAVVASSAPAAPPKRSLVALAPVTIGYSGDLTFGVSLSLSSRAHRELSLVRTKNGEIESHDASARFAKRIRDHEIGPPGRRRRRLDNHHLTPASSSSHPFESPRPLSNPDRPRPRRGPHGLHRSVRCLHPRAVVAPRLGLEAGRPRRRRGRAPLGVRRLPRAAGARGLAPARDARRRAPGLWRARRCLAVRLHSLLALRFAHERDVRPWLVRGGVGGGRAQGRTSWVRGRGE